jgi:hypothetical protein
MSEKNHLNTEVRRSDALLGQWETEEEDKFLHFLTRLLVIVTWGSEMGILIEDHRI